MGREGTAPGGELEAAGPPESHRYSWPRSGANKKRVGKMGTWGMAESCWQGHGEGLGGIWGGWGRNLGWLGGGIGADAHPLSGANGG